MTEGWRVSVSVTDLPREKRKLDPRSAARDLRGRLNDGVRISSAKTHLYLYADTVDWAEEARRAVQDLLIEHNVSADVRLERWNPFDQAWQDELAKSLLPPLCPVDAFAVDGDLKVPVLQHGDELVGEIEIAPGVGNEHLELAAGRHARRIHSNDPNCNK